MPTTVVNPSKWATITGQSSAVFTTARENGSSVSNNSPSDTSVGIRYSVQSGRGADTHAFNRSYYYFDLSSAPDLSGLTTASLDINGYVNADGKVIIVSSSAFGGDGSSNATTGEFYTSLDYSQPYSDTNGQQWVTGSNSFDLDTSHVINYLKSNPNAFILSIIDYTNDYGNTIGSATINRNEGVKLSDHPSGVDLTLITPDTTNIDNINGVSYNINNRFSGVLLSGIGKINGIE